MKPDRESSRCRGAEKSDKRNKQSKSKRPRPRAEKQEQQAEAKGQEQKNKSGKVRAEQNQRTWNRRAEAAEHMHGNRSKALRTKEHKQQADDQRSKIAEAARALQQKHRHQENRSPKNFKSQFGHDRQI